MEACREIDKTMAGYGQAWVSDNSIVDVKEMMSARQFAERFGISEWDVRNWAKRHPNRIRKYKAANGRTLYRVGDVLAFQATKGK